MKDFPIFSGQEKLKQNRLQFQNQERLPLKKYGVGGNVPEDSGVFITKKARLKGNWKKFLSTLPSIVLSFLLSLFSSFIRQLEKESVPLQGLQKLT